MRFRKDKCSQTRGILSAYMDQQLGLHEREEVEQHLKACRGCQQELDSLRATVQLLHRVPQVSPARSFAVTEAKPMPRWSPFPVLRTATAVVAAFLVLVFALDVVNVFEAGPVSTQEEGASSYDSEKGGLLGDGASRAESGHQTMEGEEEYLSPDGEDGAAHEDVTNGDEETAAAAGEGTRGEEEAGWVRPLEFGLLGVVMVFGGVTIAGWRKKKKLKVG